MRTVLCGEGAEEPSAAIRWYLKEHPASARDPVQIVFGVRRTPPNLPEPLPAGLSVSALVPGRGLRGVAHLHYLRWSYHQTCEHLLDGSFAPDVVIACCAEPDGSVRSLGTVSGYMQLVLDRARTLVLEEVSSMAIVPGAASTARQATVILRPQDEISAFRELSGSPDSVDVRISENVAGLVPARAVLALGVGRVADATAARLRARSGLKIVTGAVTAAIRDLDVSGALDAAQPIRAMSVIGDPLLQAWAASSGRVLLEPSTRLHDASWLAKLGRFTVVLGGLTVDRHGNVNAEETDNGALISGVGGAPDLAAGGHRSRDGLSIVALRSRDRRGRPALADELPRVTVPGELVDALVTEHGTAVLRGLSGSARAAAIASLFPSINDLVD